MNRFPPRPCAIRRVSWVVALGLLAACDPKGNGRLQGYVEGELTYVASPLPGAVESLDVRKGTSVRAGDLLFTLDSVAEAAAREEAGRRLAEARARLADAKKGKRPSEITALEAELERARAALALSETEAARQERLLAEGVVPAQDRDRASAKRDQDREQVAQLEADLETARLGARSDQIAAAEATVRAQEAVLAQAEWNLAQKRQEAPLDGLVFDTLYRQGEWVAAGRPVVALLAPENIKVRAFVPEGRIGAIRLGDRVQVRVDGRDAPLAGKVSFISPRAEYTPPVIYSRESRGKLVFLIEAVFEREIAASLHPGQPVDVELGS